MNANYLYYYVALHMLEPQVVASVDKHNRLLGLFSLKACVDKQKPKHGLVDVYALRL